jgi:uncharacterized membrane protein YdjX (TVP38/TMEM64 family)
MRFLRIAIIIIIVAVLGTFIYLSAESDPQQLLFNLLEQWESNYTWIILIIFAIILFSTLTGLPVLYLSVALGFFMGYLPGLALAWVFNFLAVMASFYMVRSLYSAYFKKRYGRKKLIQRINNKISKYGFWTVAVTRSVYFIPTNIINFSFPLSKISTPQYVIGTMLGLIPESLINISTGYLLKHEMMLMHDPQQNILKILVIGASLILMMGAFIFFRYRKNRSKGPGIKEYVPLLDEE